MIEIKELILRIPGLNPEEAQKLGEEVAQRLADNLPPGVGSRCYLDHLNVHLTIPTGASRSHLAHMISDAILKRIE